VAPRPDEIGPAMTFDLNSGYGYGSAGRSTGREGGSGLVRASWGIIPNPGMQANFIRDNLIRTAKSRNRKARFMRNVGLKPNVKEGIPSRASLTRQVRDRAAGGRLSRYSGGGRSGSGKKSNWARGLTEGGTPQLSRVDRIMQLANMPELRGRKELSRIRKGGSTYESPGEKAGRQLVSRLKGMPEDRGKASLDALYSEQKKRRAGSTKAAKPRSASEAKPGWAKGEKFQTPGEIAGQALEKRLTNMPGGRGKKSLDALREQARTDRARAKTDALKGTASAEIRNSKPTGKTRGKVFALGDLYNPNTSKPGLKKLTKPSQAKMTTTQAIPDTALESKFKAAVGSNIAAWKTLATDPRTSAGFKTLNAKDRPGGVDPGATVEKVSTKLKERSKQKATEAKAARTSTKTTEASATQATQQASRKAAAQQSQKAAAKQAQKATAQQAQKAASTAAQKAASKAAQKQAQRAATKAAAKQAQKATMRAATKAAAKAATKAAVKAGAAAAKKK